MKINGLKSVRTYPPACSSSLTLSMLSIFSAISLDARNRRDLCWFILALDQSINLLIISSDNQSIRQSINQSIHWRYAIKVHMLSSFPGRTRAVNQSINLSIKYIYLSINQSTWAQRRQWPCRGASWAGRWRTDGRYTRR